MARGEGSEVRGGKGERLGKRGGNYVDTWAELGWAQVSKKGRAVMGGRRSFSLARSIIHA